MSTQATEDRGGFCKFKVRHLGAAHSLGQYALEITGNKDFNKDTPLTLFIMVERDGSTRNSMVAQYAQQMYSHNSQLIETHVMDCMWMISSECQSDKDRDIDNTCGVPHSSMSFKDNINKPPFHLWWNHTYYNGVLSFLTNNQVSAPSFAFLFIAIACPLFLFVYVWQKRGLREREKKMKEGGWSNGVNQFYSM